MHRLIRCLANFRWLSLAAVALTQPLAAQTAPIEAKVGFNLRLDAFSEAVDTAGKKTQQQSFRATTARVIVGGKVGADVGFLLRLDVKSPRYGAEQAGQDGAIAALDRAYIEHTLAEGLNLRLGRMPLFYGSLENDYSSMDAYYASAFIEAMGKLTPFTSGADLSYNVAGQTVTLQVFNGLQETVGTHKGLQKGENLSTAIGYRGRLFGGIVKPIVSYTMISRIRGGEGAMRDDAVTYRAGGLGTQISAAGFDFDVEYDRLLKPGFTSHTWDAKDAVTTVENTENRMDTYVTQLAYNAAGGKARPFVKFSRDTETQAGDEILVAHRNAVGAEYRPGPKGFRYHAVVVDKHDDRTAATGVKTRTNVRQYILGVAAKI